MSRAARAYFGAMLGALLTLFWHPISRPFLWNGFSHWGASAVARSTPLIAGNLVRLPVPKSELDASLWLQAGSERLWVHRPPSDADRENLVLVARNAAVHEPENAYWRQMEAVFLGSLGRQEEARKAWVQAAKAVRWNDYQSVRLLGVREELAREEGSRLAWQLAFALRLRSSANAQAIRSFSRQVVSGTDLVSPAGLETRWASVMNARLMRDGARSIETGQTAAEMMEAASHPAGLPVARSHRVLLLARYDLINALMAAGMSERSNQVNRAYDSNDSWIALTRRVDTQEFADMSILGALATATVPSALLAVAALGAILWMVGTIVHRSAVVRQLLAPPAAPALGVVFAVLAYLATGLVLAAIAVVLCFAFLVFTPPRVRSLTPDELGPLFRFILALLGMAIASTFGAFIASLSTPACELLFLIGVPREYYGGSTLFLGLSGIVLGLLLLISPGWALAQRIATPKVVGVAMRDLGCGLCAVCLGLAVVSAPAAVYADRVLNQNLQMLVENEPNYHLLQ
ncbi:MAG: hypothetical protein M9921_08830 [Fimbriimonadaceae bacterium]|nr:hypothetical protein [Chthonomonadaceae bacterium]MCO5296948.1 hypothetical protein [Fimbriimonadaceae bacterium]